MQIAIDGPSGVGKSTVAKRLSEKLNINYLDTGSMYRALALKVEISGFCDFKDKQKLDDFFKNTKIDIIDNQIYLDDKLVEGEIRNEHIGKLASQISSNELVREYLVNMQRELAKGKSVIMDGRDIGTVVIKDSKYKYFLDARSDVRAKRRLKQLEESGIEAKLEDIINSIEERDYRDKNRKHSPLRKADDAILIDTSDKSIDDVVSMILKDISRKSNV